MLGEYTLKTILEKLFDDVARLGLRRLVVDSVPFFLAAGDEVAYIGGTVKNKFYVNGVVTFLEEGLEIGSGGSVWIGKDGGLMVMR